MDLFIKLSQQKKYLEDIGYNVLYIGLFGSQNYGLADVNSDVDSRAVVLPTIEQLIKRERISKKYKTELGEIDVKDVLWFYEVIRKGNFTFIEVMQTKYFIGDKFLRILFKDITLNLKSLRGDMYGKADDFRKEFAGKAKEISEWGYDPKQIHHIFRLLKLVESRDITKSFIDYTDQIEERDWLMDIKRNRNNIVDNLSDILDISSAKAIKDWIDFKTKTYISDDYDYKELDILEEVTKYVKEKLKVSMFKDKVAYARQHRTFDQPIPKKDLEKFEALRDLNGKDISYIIYESIDIL
jgi:hypothetical protein